MDIVEEREGDVLVLVPVGRLDTTTSRDFEKKLLELVNGGNVHYVIDFERLEYVSSAGLRVLVMLGKRLPGMGGSLVLSSLSPQVKEVFDIAGFTRIFQIVGDRKRALGEIERLRLSQPGKSAAKGAAKPKAGEQPGPAAAAPAKAKPKAAAAPAAKPAEEAAAKPAAKPATAKPAAAPAPKTAPAAEAPAPSAPAKPAKRSVEELAIELLKKGEAPPFLEQKKSK
jgi:anti-anti-sigma factor